MIECFVETPLRAKRRGPDQLKEGRYSPDYCCEMMQPSVGAVVVGLMKKGQV